MRFTWHLPFHLLCISCARRRGRGVQSSASLSLGVLWTALVATRTCSWGCSCSSGCSYVSWMPLHNPICWPPLLAQLVPSLAVCCLVLLCVGFLRSADAPAAARMPLPQVFWSVSACLLVRVALGPLEPPCCCALLGFPWYPCALCAVCCAIRCEWSTAIWFPRCWVLFREGFDSTPTLSIPFYH